MFRKHELIHYSYRYRKDNYVLEITYAEDDISMEVRVKCMIPYVLTYATVYDVTFRRWKSDGTEMVIHRMPPGLDVNVKKIKSLIVESFTEAYVPEEIIFRISDTLSKF